MAYDEYDEIDYDFEDDEPEQPDPEAETAWRLQRLQTLEQIAQLEAQRAERIDSGLEEKAEAWDDQEEVEEHLEDLADTLAEAVPELEKAVGRRLSQQEVDVVLKTALNSGEVPSTLKELQAISPGTKAYSVRNRSQRMALAEEIAAKHLKAQGVGRGGEYGYTDDE